jgi:hypothetical protein
MKGFIRLAALLLALGTVVPSGLNALEVEQGGIRLVLHEGIGRFSLYYRDNPPDSAFVPLFVDQDPRTSSLSLLLGNKIIRLGDGGDFREQAEKTVQGARFTWRSNQLGVTQEFRLPASRPDVVVMEVSVTNLTAAALDVGLRLCLDTYLGETQLAHFRTDAQAEITRELTLLPTDGVRYWSSAAPQRPVAGGQAGLFCLISGAEATVPDRVVFANWKRLSEASWTYETSQTRNFNLVPYSINDSAVCHYYDPAALPPKATRQIVLVLGNLTGLAAASAASATGAATAPSAAEPALAPPSQTLQGELEVLDSLLRRLAEYLAPGSTVSFENLEQDVRLMRETLSGIKNRSARY